MGTLARGVEDIISNGYALISIDTGLRDAVSAIYEMGYEFFRSPAEDKIRSALPPLSGYRPRGIEYSHHEDHPDEMESFTATATASDITSIASKPGRILYQQMQETIRLLESLAERLTLELVHKINPEFDTSALLGGFHSRSTLQLNYSQPAQCSQEFINDPHEDGHLITLAMADAPGLELQAVGGDFKPVEQDRGTIAVMPGETAYLLSGGVVKPLYHQVRRNVHVTERLAVIYFGEFEPTLCEPWIRSAVNKDVDIGARIRANDARFGLPTRYAD